jgi:hypothetical protein
VSAFQTFTSAFRSGNRGRPARGWITPLKIGSDKPVDADARAFQYFPESITDSKVNNYQAKEIPGLSHPLYQWTAGGPRELSFTAVFSADIPPADPDGPDRHKELIARNVDVDAAIAWIQSYQYPEYSKDVAKADGPRTGRDRPAPPRKILLTLPNVAINFGRPEICPDEMNCILLSAEVSRESFFPSGATRLAKVELTFAEIIQMRNTVRPHDAFLVRREALSRYKLDTSAANPSEGRLVKNVNKTEIDKA